jgi:predicted Kef-type K+ transport protein
MMKHWIESILLATIVTVFVLAFVLGMIAGAFN